jgi:catechol 2,3-dioxygenase-like lactoylglutathione lyase family enzyme
MNWTLEVVVVPVSDVDCAKDFYANQLGFHLDHDTKVGDRLRVVQLTPPGSGCSVVIGQGLNEMQPRCSRPTGRARGRRQRNPGVGSRWQSAFRA